MKIFERYSLEEILFAVDAVASAEALLRQLRLTVAAFQALAVPVAIQHFEDKAVHDVLIAACTHWDFCRRHDGITLVDPVYIGYMLNGMETKNDNPTCVCA